MVASALPPALCLLIHSQGGEAEGYSAAASGGATSRGAAASTASASLIVDAATTVMGVARKQSSLRPLHPEPVTRVLSLLLRMLGGAVHVAAVSLAAATAAVKASCRGSVRATCPAAGGEAAGAARG